MKIKTGTKVESGANNKEKGVSLVISDKKGKEEITADVVLVSTGRSPFTAGLAAEKAGLTLNKFGKFDVNKTW